MSIVRIRNDCVYVYGPRWCRWCEQCTQLLTQSEVLHRYMSLDQHTQLPDVHRIGISQATRYPIIFVGTDATPLGGYPELVRWLGLPERDTVETLVTVAPTPPCRAFCIRTNQRCTRTIDSPNSLYYCCVHHRRALRSVPVRIHTRLVPPGCDFLSSATRYILNVEVVDDDVEADSTSEYTPQDAVVAGWGQCTQGFNELSLFVQWARVAQGRTQCTHDTCCNVARKGRPFCTLHL